MAAAAQREIHDHYAREARRQGYVARPAYKLLEIQQKRTIIRRGDRILDLGCAPGAWLQVACQLLGPLKAGGEVIGIDLKPVRIPQKYCDRRAAAIQGDALSMSLEDIVRMAAATRPGAGQIKTDTTESGSSSPEGHADTAKATPLAEEGGHDTAEVPAVVEPFDVVLSDMMGSTAGHQATDHFRSVELARRALALAGVALRPGGRFVVKVFEGEAYPDFLNECRAAFDFVKGFSPKASRAESREMFVICDGFRGNRPPPGS